MGKNLKARGSPELWLSAIEKRLAEQMRKLTKDVLEILNVPGDCEDTDDRELSQFPLQVSGYNIDCIRDFIQTIVTFCKC